MSSAMSPNEGRIGRKCPSVCAFFAQTLTACQCYGNNAPSIAGHADRYGLIEERWTSTELSKWMMQGVPQSCRS